MTCPDYERIEKYIDGRLDKNASAELEVHLKSCEECSAYLNNAKNDAGLIAELREYFNPCLGTAEKSLPIHVETVEYAQRLLGSQYRIIRKAGRGSVSDIFEAIDTVLERRVAIKFLAIKKDDQTGKNEANRWQEARIMGQLNHPNITHLYHIGQAQDFSYIVMEWIDGLPLTEAWRDMPLEQRLGLYLQVTEAVSAAHQRDIVHCDIKPSNILVDASGHVKALDFGIAFNYDRSPLADSLYRGTPAFSAPEQITPPVRITAAVDVFSLGVLLYQLLTDTLPFGQSNTIELFNAIRNKNPQIPTSISEKVPISLQNICLKCLEKEPRCRYSDAGQLADDIKRFLRGEKIWAKPPFLNDSIRQDVFFHSQKLSVWKANDLLTENEYDKLTGIYDRVVSPNDPSIIEARKLSLSQTCLYLGGWITVIGCFVLFYKSWENIPLVFRPLPAAVAAAIMMIIGIRMWQKKES